MLVELAQPRPRRARSRCHGGTGIVARIGATRSVQRGAVVGIDLNPGMFNVADRWFARPGIATLQWQEASADKLPSPDGSLNVVYCQLGLQFFADQTAALREMRRVSGAEGRLALMVWRGIHESLGFAVLAEALERHVGQAAEPARAIRVVQCRRIRSSRSCRRFSERCNSPAKWDGPLCFGRAICIELRWRLAAGQPGIQRPAMRRAER